MKKGLFAVAAVALLFATSCKKESVNPAVDVPEGSFLATIDNGANPQNAPAVKDGMGTMTTIDGSNYVIWENGDKISINGSTYTTTSTPGSSAVFSGGNATGTTFHAFFPATIAGTDNAGALPATQTIELDGDNNITVRNLPMYATSTNNQLTFNNICAALKITIPSFLNGATSIEVSSSDKAMNGAFTVTDNVAVMTATTPSDAEKKVTIAKASGTFATDEVIYIAVPANTYSNFKVEFFNGQTSMWNKTLATCTLDVNKVYNINVTPSDIPVNCFNFTATGTVTVGMQHGSSSPTINLEYNKYTVSTNDYSGWTDFTSGVSLDNGDKVYFKAKYSNNKLSNASYGTNFNKFTSTGTGTLSVSGNIMYLLNGTTPPTTLTTTNSNAFSCLFKGMSNLKDASQLNLPAKTLSNYCYCSMFQGCGALENSPALPAETLADYCYYQMFESCSALTTAPELPATTLVFGCYWQMFGQCSALKEVTMLATSIPTNSYCLSSWLAYAGSNVTKTSSTHLVHVASGMTTNTEITSSLEGSGSSGHKWTAVNP